MLWPTNLGKKSKISNGARKLGETMKITDSITVKKERVIYLTFYREFYKNFLAMSNGQDQIILAGAFLHLTFESLITYTIRLFLNTAYSHQGQGVKRLWHNIFETERLDKKLQFFSDILAINNDTISRTLKNIDNFYRNKLSPLRNKVLHGHEVSETILPNGRLERSKLSGMLTETNIKDLYSEFWRNVELFLDLFNNVVVPEGVNLSPDFIKKDLIQGAKDNLRRIELEFVKQQ